MIEEGTGLSPNSLVFGSSVLRSLVVIKDSSEIKAICLLVTLLVFQAAAQDQEEIRAPDDGETLNQPAAPAATLV